MAVSGEVVTFTNLKRRIKSYAEIFIPAILFCTTGLSSPGCSQPDPTK